MKENKLTIQVNVSVEELFAFTTNPAKTHLWIPTIIEEVSSAFPPQTGSIYKNRGESGVWDEYRVVEVELNKVFTLSDREKDYHVRYTYTEVSDEVSELEYYEWVEKSNSLAKPFPSDALISLKEAIEKRK